MPENKGLSGLVSEWRKESDAIDQCGEFHADELQPFLERLEALEQRMKHEEKNEYYDAMTPSGMRTFLDQDCMETCVKCQLRSILHGEQPKGGE